MKKMIKLLLSNYLLLLWRIKGRPVPPPHKIKQLCVRDYGKIHNTNVLIETGTYLGDMVEAQLNNFEIIYSIELSGDLYKKALKKFSGNKKVSLYNGDSGIILKEIMPRIKEKSLFWLDGHYSGGITAKGGKNCPIMEELNAILSSDIEHILLIDDARLFNGTNDYPTIQELKNYILSIYSNSTIVIENDIIRIVLKK